MKTPAREALDAYYAEAGSWAHDREEMLVSSRRTAWIVAAIAIVVALCLALALVILMPLKTVVPYTLLVDRQTGYVQTLKPLDPATVSSDTALTQSFLVQYVIAREGYDFDTLQTNYRKVALWSAGDARSSYIAGVQVSAPDSPLARYPRSTTIGVDVKSVSSLGKNVAMVRFDTRRIDARTATRPVRSWVAVIRYSYSGAPMSLDDRLINPLGFKVTRYRKDIELLPQPVEPGVAEAQGTQPASAMQNGLATVVPARQLPANPRTTGGAAR